MNLIFKIIRTSIALTYIIYFCFPLRLPNPFKLEGQVDDCSCNVDTVDHYNNDKIHPRLQSLLPKDYFRFYKINLKRECPFWSDDSRCAMRYCHVEPCMDDDIPPGLRGYSMKRQFQNEDMSVKFAYSFQPDECESDLDPELSYLNTTISAAAYEEFALWQAYDDAQDNFCLLPDEDGAAEYVDLLLNPERYTGYRGKSAHRIWRSIYRENCFGPKSAFDNAYGGLQSSKLSGKEFFENIYLKYSNDRKMSWITQGLLANTSNKPQRHEIDRGGMCLEKRVFYRVISGLHASINIHLSSKYLLSEKSSLGMLTQKAQWGPNLQEFKNRFGPEETNGEGPQWLRNLYFVYLLELRALAKAAPYLEREEYYTGNESEDVQTKAAIKDFLSVVKSFPNHFNESSMFSGGKQARKLKEEFRQHFRNISQIMDCVGCEKCKLWGKLQIQGLGTALKILFSGKFDKLNSNENGNSLLALGKRFFQLERSEIVALFNAFGRLSNSIFALEQFRKMMR
ncbi:endoplasmic reticulum oxidoreductin-1-like protein isoform X3 [Lycorma delicatula]|uniref:endoplasmic reticulum oxidoreductin-1-like protein isoform X3 n=1 Tax=Lycorma delicatula TaxID=130591 RepID=UPI003F515A0D